MAALDIPTLRFLLAKFLPDERLIKAFEQLGEVTTENVDTIIIALTTATEALTLGYAAGAELGGAPIPEALLPVPNAASQFDYLMPIPDASPMLPVLASGTYTPTLTNVANVAASTAYAAQWLRLGSTVTVSGKVDIDPTATTATTLALSLPVASNLSAEEQCAGTAANGTLAAQSAAILGDPVNDLALLSFDATNTANRSWFYTFTYRVI